MGQVEFFSVDFRSERLAVNDDPAFFSQIISATDVVIAGEEVYFHAHIRQFGQLAEKAGVTFGHDRAEFVPEVEHVAQQIYGSRLMFDTVEEVD